MKHNEEFFEMQMREVAEDGPFELLVLEALDTLYAVREMTPERRAKALPDLQEAIALLVAAEKECRW